MRVPFLDRLFRRGLEEEVLKLRREVFALKQRQVPAGRGIVSHEPLLVIARALRDAKSADAFADAALGAAIGALGADRGALIVEREGELAVLAARDSKQPLDPSSFAWSRTIAGVAVREAQVVATGRAAEDERFRAHASVARHGIESVLALPLPRGQGAPGCLYLEAPRSGFAALDPATLLALTDLTAVALGRLADEADAARRAKLQAVGLAAAAIAHDLRSPLSTIEFALGLLEPSGDDDTRACSMARTACVRVRELSAGLVSLATGRERELTLRPERVADVVEEHLRLVEEELRASNVHVSRELDPSAVALVDRSALLRVLDNLTRNAQRALTEGGNLELLCGGRSAEPGFVLLQVADDGPGMPPEKLARVFQLSADLGAGGLGLVLIRDLVLRMGGKIEAASELGKGARFTILLPAILLPTGSAA